MLAALAVAAGPNFPQVTNLCHKTNQGPRGVLETIRSNTQIARIFANDHRPFGGLCEMLPQASVLGLNVVENALDQGVNIRDGVTVVSLEIEQIRQM
jgi:hypothetical protein